MKATYKQYEDYIYQIKQALGIPIDTRINFHFLGNLGNRGGDAVVRRNGSIRIRIRNYEDHITTLQILMHELKHAQQMVQGRLSINAKLKWFWLGKPIKVFRANTDPNSEYKQSPWEIEAYAYQKKHNSLFPDGKIVTKSFVGRIGNIKFYKVKG